MNNPALPQAAEPVVPSEERWAEALALPCRVGVDIPISGFTVGQLLKLQLHSVAGIGQEESTNVPVQVSGQLIGWGQLEVQFPISIPFSVRWEWSPTENVTSALFSAAEVSSILGVHAR